MLLSCCWGFKKKIIFLPKQMDLDLREKCVNLYFLWSRIRGVTGVAICRANGHNFLLIQSSHPRFDKSPGALICICLFCRYSPAPAALQRYSPGYHPTSLQPHSRGLKHLADFRQLLQRGSEILDRDSSDWTLTMISGDHGRSSLMDQGRGVRGMQF